MGYYECPNPNCGNRELRIDTEVNSLEFKEYGDYTNCDETVTCGLCGCAIGVIWY